MSQKLGLHFTAHKRVTVTNGCKRAKNARWPECRSTHRGGNERVRTVLEWRAAFTMRPARDFWRVRMAWRRCVDDWIERVASIQRTRHDLL
jgi:hypothetical protein